VVSFPLVPPLIISEPPAPSWRAMGTERVVVNRMWLPAARPRPEDMPRGRTARAGLHHKRGGIGLVGRLDTSKNRAVEVI
jgi:hypothetical protein